MRNKALIILTVIGFASLPFLIYFSTPKSAPTVAKPPSDFNADYSNLNKLSPGKSTYDDALRINGSPISESKVGELTILSYPTPNETFNNTVAIKDGVVIFSAEYVYSVYRGYYSDYVKKFGQPSLSLYADGSPYINWYIFLDHGIGVEASNNDISQIVYFVPQDKNSFMKNMASFLKLSQEKAKPVEEDVVF